MNAEVGTATEAELQQDYGADNVTFVQCDVTNTNQLKGEGQMTICVIKY